MSQSMEVKLDSSLLLMPAKTAHAEGVVRYQADGTVLFSHPGLKGAGLPAEISISPDHQFSGIRATFDDLNKSISRLANSPVFQDGKTLRKAYEEEASVYEELSNQAYAEGRWEPDYGTYVFDTFKKDLYLLAPERWHRTALVTSNSKLLTDPEEKLSWEQIRNKLENAVIGFMGVSVGGNLLEGWLREARPRQVKIADLDWVESTNFNRGERMSIRHLVGARGSKFDPRNPYAISTSKSS